MARSINTPKTKPSPKAWSQSKSIHTGHRSIARAVARRARGSRSFVVNASQRNGASCSGVLSVTTRPTRTTMPQPMCITRSTTSGIGSLGKRRRRRPHQAAEVTRTPSPATGRGEKPARGAPRQRLAGQARLQASRHVNVVGLSLAQGVTFQPGSPCGRLLGS